jgi:hypothetical protein
MYKHRLLLLMALLVLVAIACNMPAIGTTPQGQPAEASPTASASAAGGESATPEPAETEEQPTEAPTATDEPTEQPSPTPATPEPATHGDVIYESNLQAGWPDIHTDNGSGGHVPGGYLISIPDGDTWAFWVFTTRVNEVDFYAEVEATPNDCPARQGAYGMLFQHRDESNLRSLSITCDGRYVLLERNDGAEVVLAENPLPQEIDPSTGSHTVGVKALDNTITAYADDYPLISMSIPGMEGGDFGPYVQTGGGATSVLFTHLVIYEPE